MKDWEPEDWAYFAFLFCCGLSILAISLGGMLKDISCH